MMNNGTGVLLHAVLFLVHENPSENSVNSNAIYNVQNGNDGFPETRCYEPYGCFNISSPWITETRPVSLFPKTPEEIDPKFPMFTRHTLERPKYLDVYDQHSIREADINPAGPIYLISHGYMESGNRPWIHAMAQKLLAMDTEGTASVIVIDWSGGSNPPYAEAVANIRLVGAITGHLIAAIKNEYKLPNLDNVHIIGHSLGAHLAGYAGYTLQKEFGFTLGRITGMDPAEPHFANTEPIVRLDRTDAKYVDVIHTDASPFISGGLGIAEAIGHVDYFPNGGSKQPGCDQNVFDYISLERGSFIKGIRRFLGCNHIRSYEYFTESITPGSSFMTISCENYEKFKNGECYKCGHDGHFCIPFGYHGYKTYRHLVDSYQLTSSRSISSYLLTGDQKPYARAHYRITVNISSSEESAIHGGEVGRLWIKVRSMKNMDTEKIPLADNNRFYEPNTQHTVVVPGREVGPPMSAMLEWEFRTNPFNPLTWRILSSPMLYVGWISIDSIEHQNSIRLCPQDGSPVIANKPISFKQEYCY